MNREVGTRGSRVPVGAAERGADETAARPDLVHHRDRCGYLAVLILTQDTVRSPQVVPASAGFHVVTG